MKVPSYRRHAGSGQAIVTLKGRDCYLGKFGSAESRERYRALIAGFMQTGAAPQREDDPPTISECMVGYLGHIHQHYRTPSGGLGNQAFMIKKALKVLRSLFGDTP